MSASSDTSLSRRERERRRRRRAMLEAARAVFAERGYAQATLEEIAERAEFGKGTLYNYFEGGKEEMLFALFEDIFGEIEALIQTVFQEELNEEQSLREAFHTFAKRHYQLVLDRQQLFLILVKEGHLMAFSDDTERVRFFQQQHQRLVNALIPVLREAMEEREIQHLPPSSVAHLLLANVRGIGIHSILQEWQTLCDEEHCDELTTLNDSEHTADFLTTLLFDGLETKDASHASA